MKNTRVIFLFVLVCSLFVACNSDRTNKAVSELNEIESPSPTTVKEEARDAENKGEIIKEKEAEVIVDKKVEKAKSADEKARSESPFKSKSCSEILQMLEKDINANQNNPLNLEKAIKPYLTDIVPTLDCFNKDEEYRKFFNQLKRKAIELMTVEESEEDSEY